MRAHAAAAAAADEAPRLLSLASIDEALALQLTHGMVLAAEPPGALPSPSAPARQLRGVMYLIFVHNSCEHEAQRGGALGAPLLRGAQESATRALAALLTSRARFPLAQRAYCHWVLPVGTGASAELVGMHEAAVLALAPSPALAVPLDACLWTLLMAGIAGASGGPAAAQPRVPGVALHLAGTLVVAAGGDTDSGSGGAAPRLFSESLLDVSQPLLAALAAHLEKADASILPRLLCAGLGPLMRALVASGAAGNLDSTERVRFVCVALGLAGAAPLARALAASDLMFGSGSSGAALQHSTLLGVLFSATALPGGDATSSGLPSPSPVLRSFAHVHRRDRSHVRSTTQTLQALQAGAWDVGARALRSLFDADDDVAAAGGGRPAREAALGWLAAVLAANADKVREHGSSGGRLSDDALLVNLGAALCRLVEPIAAGSVPLACIAPDTPLAAAAAAAAADAAGRVELVAFMSCGSAATEAGAARFAPAAAAAAAEAPFKPLTRLLCHCLRALELGLGRVIRLARNERRQLEYYASVAFGNGEDGDGSDEEDDDGGDGRRRGARRAYAYLLANTAACDVVRLHPLLLLSAARAAALACDVMTRALLLGDGSGGGGAWPAEATVGDWSALLARAACTPAPLSEAQLYSLLAVLRHAAEAADIFGEPAGVAPLSSAELSAVLHALLALLALPPGAAAHPASPHLRAAIGDTLYALFVPAWARPADAEEEAASAARRARRCAGDAAAALLAAPTPFVRAALVPALMDVYGAVEGTGHYERAGHRQRVTTLLALLLRLPAHAAAFGGAAAFLNGLVSHVTALLTEGLGGLPVIRETTAQAHAGTGAWAPDAPAADRVAAGQQLAATRHAVRSALLLASETLGLLAALSDVAEARAGLAGETIVGRLADMLVHALTALAGPAGVKLKVADAAALNFRPVELLRAVLHTTLRMAAMPAFLAAVAASGMLDGKVWDKVDAVVERVGGLPAAPAAAGAPTLDDFRAFRAAIDRAASDEAAEDALFADPPDDFVDQILGTLMRDPVATPAGSVYERRAILECLLQKPEDPANRQPLRAEDLRPLPDLKARIEAWKEERRAAAAAAKPKSP